MASQVHFTRMDPEVRKAHLIDATLVCLKQYGFQGMSVRKICAQAGVSPGLISHHYAGKDELVAEAYQAITRQVMGQLREAMQNAAGQGARERLSAFFQASLSEKLLNPHLLEAWLAFWGAVKTAEAINHAHDKSYKEYRSILAHALGQLALEECWVDFDSSLAAIGLTALLDGLWLEHGLDPDTFTPAEAVLICEAWIDGLLAGGFRRFCVQAQRTG